MNDHILCSWTCHEHAIIDPSFAKLAYRKYKYFFLIHYVMEEKDEFIERSFRCNICNKTHFIKLNKRIIEGREKFPFPYVFLHDQVIETNYKELLTILYIDKNLQVRHTEVQELGYDPLFSKEQVVSMMKPLLEEIELLRGEVEKLTKELNLYKKSKKLKKKELKKLFS